MPRRSLTLLTLAAAPLGAGVTPLAPVPAGPSAIAQVHREYGPRGLSVLAIGTQEDRARVDARVREKRPTALGLEARLRP